MGKIIIILLFLGLIFSPVNAVNENRGRWFDGVDDDITFPNESNYDLQPPFTIECWIKTEDQDGTPTYIYGKGLTSSGQNYALFITGGENAYFQVYHDGAEGGAGTSDVMDNDWHHIAGVHHGDKLHLYVDGKLEMIDNSLTGAIDLNNDPLNIGDTDEGTWAGYQGQVARARLWTVALTTSQVKTAMKRIIKGEYPDLIKNVRFISNTGNVKDYANVDDSTVVIGTLFMEGAPGKAKE